MAGTPTTNLVSLSETVNAAHLSLLVGIAQHTADLFLSGDAEHKVFPVLLGDVFAQFAQQPGRPLLFHLDALVLVEQGKKGAKVHR